MARTQAFAVLLIALLCSGGALAAQSPGAGHVTRPLGSGRQLKSQQGGPWGQQFDSFFGGWLASNGYHMGAANAIAQFGSGVLAAAMAQAVATGNDGVVVEAMASVMCSGNNSMASAFSQAFAQSISFNPFTGCVTLQKVVARAQAMCNNGMAKSMAQSLVSRQILPGTCNVFGR